MSLRRRLGRLEQRVGPAPACAACAGRQGLIALVTSQRLPDGTVVPQGDWPGLCEACGQIPEFIIEVVETVVDSEGNPI